MKSVSIITALGILVAVFIAGCDTYNTQTTSGKEYLSRYPEESRNTGVSDIDQQVREVANVEPTLRFPARIGLAKLYNGKISNLRPEEVEAWTKAREALGSDFGEFIPVSSLIAESVYEAPADYSPVMAPAELLRKVRLGAARQHLDVVLIYEVFSKTTTTSLASSVADWTIIGMYFIPSKDLQTTGVANALLMDVLSGYPYGTASASLEEQELATTVGSWDKKEILSDKTELATVLQLIPEVQSMMVDLMEALKEEE